MKEAIDKLEQLAAYHEHVAKVIRQLAKGLSDITGVPPGASASYLRLTQAQRKAKTTRHPRKSMSAAARKNLSDKAKQRWAEKRKAEASGKIDPKLYSSERIRKRQNGGGDE